MDDNKVYYDHEILQILMGLDIYYQSKPWYLKWWYRQWHAVIEILSIQLCGDLLNENHERQQAIDFVEGLIEDESV